MELHGKKTIYPVSLLNQSLTKLSDDDVFLDYLDSIEDIPKTLLKRLAGRLSAYGLCTLESKRLLESAYTTKCWKVLYFQVSNKFYEPMSRLSTPEIDVKDLYFQRVFHEVLLCFSGETESTFSDNHFQKVCTKSRMFSYINRTLISRSLERLKTLFRDNLNTIRVYYCLLKKLFSTLMTSCIIREAFMNIKAIELRDFMYMTDRHIHMLRSVLTTKTVPRLVTIKFVNCKFNHDAMKWFDQLSSEFGHEICDDEVEFSNGTDLPCKVPKLYFDEEISFDEAICFGSPGNGTPHTKHHGSSNVISEMTTETHQNNVVSNLLKVAFVNCHFDPEAINKLCEIMRKLQNLKSFTFCPEWRCSLRNADRILPLMLQQSDNTSVAVPPCIEEIEMEDCPLGYYTQKLLLWHLPGECMIQHGITVPKPKYLKIADCNLDSFRIACSCFGIKDFKQSLSGNSSEELSHTENCNSANVWKFDALNTCSCNWLNLIKIDLSDNKLGEKGAEALAYALENSPCLQLIKLSFCSMNTRGCSYIFNMASNHKRLRSLDLSNNSYDGREDSSASKLIENGTVAELVLSTLFVPGGLTTAVIKSFSKNSTIQMLDLSTNRLRDSFFSSLIDVLADPLALSALQILDLSQNLIQLKLIPEFAKSLETSNRKLKDLKITGNMNDITDQQCYDILRRRVENFSNEDSLPSHMVVSRMADHVSEM